MEGGEVLHERHSSAVGRDVLAGGEVEGKGDALAGLGLVEPGENVRSEQSVIETYICEGRKDQDSLGRLLGRLVTDDKIVKVILTDLLDGLDEIPRKQSVSDLSGFRHDSCPGRQLGRILGLSQ